MDLGYLIVMFGLSVFGLALFVYGKRQRLIVPAVAGVILMILPYFLRDPWWLAGVGAALAAASVRFRYGME